MRDRIVYHWNYTSDPPGPLHDDTTHGTHVAGIAAGFKANVFSGVAPGANIIALQGLREGASSSQQYAAVEAALQWVEDNAAAYNIVAVNMSFSTDNRYTDHSTHPGFPVSDNFDRLVNLPQRVIPIASVGNRYGGYDSQLGVGYPAADDSVLGVGATWDVNQDVRPLYYSLGAGFNGCNESWLWQYETYVDQVAPFSQRHATMSDIFAPGADIFSSGASGSTGWALGTTQAAPFVAGAVAIAQQLSMRERGVKLTFQEFRELVRSTGATIVDNNYDPNDFQLVQNNCLADQLPQPSGLSFKRLDIYQMANQLVAPKVSAVKIGSSNAAVGHADYTVPVGNGNQLKTVPVGSPNEIIITFTEAVTVNKNHLSVVGADSGTTYNVNSSTFVNDTATKTAKWTFASPFPADQLVITLDDGVIDTAVTANALDGEWSNPASLSTSGSDTFPSGNGTAGGDFIFRVTILPGDVTRNNVVDINDLNTVVNNQGLTPAVWTQGEMTGDNVVNLSDKNLVNNNFGRNYTSWPGGGQMML